MGFIKEFKEFITRGNVLDMAVGVIIGNAFKAIVDSLVDDMLMPLITSVTGAATVEDLSFTIGNTAINYGNFLQQIINFLIIAFTIFCIVKAANTFNAKMSKLKKEQEKPADAPAAPTSEELLTEIRDLLKDKK